MKTETAKHMIDAFHEAKHILDEMPPLEQGLTPVCIHTIDVIHGMQAEGKKTYPSDISAQMQTSRPGITRTLKQLERIGMIVKKPAADGRMVEIELTPEGERIYQKYVEDYYQKLTWQLRNIDEKDIQQMAATIQAIGKAINMNEEEKNE